MRRVAFLSVGLACTAFGCDSRSPSAAVTPSAVPTATIAPPPAAASVAPAIAASAAARSGPDPAEWVRVTEKFQLVPAPKTTEDPDGEGACVLGAATKVEDLPPPLVFSECARGPAGCKQLEPFAGARFLRGDIDLDAPGGPVLAIVLERSGERLFEFARLDGRVTNALVLARGHSRRNCEGYAHLARGRYALSIQGAVDRPTGDELAVGFEVSADETTVSHPEADTGVTGTREFGRADGRRTLTHRGASVLNASDGATIWAVAESPSTVAWLEKQDGTSSCALFTAVPAERLDPRGLGKAACDDDLRVLGGYVVRAGELVHLESGRRRIIHLAACPAPCKPWIIGPAGEEVFVQVGDELERLPLAALGDGVAAQEVQWTRSGDGAPDGGLPDAGLPAASAPPQSGADAAPPVASASR